MKIPKFTNNSFLLSVSILLAVFFLSFQNSFSDIAPRYGDCNDIYMQTEGVTCSNFDIIHEVIEIYSGCFVEADYLLKICEVPGDFPHLKMELIGCRVINYSGCSGLINDLYLPNGNLNETTARKLMQDIYKIVSDKWMKNIINSNDLSTNPLWYCNSGFQPLHGVKFMEFSEGTCMALCRTTQVIQYNNPPFVVGPIGVSYTTEYISNVKCTNTCCKTYFAYCYDPHQNAWVRTTMKGIHGDNQGAGANCPNPPNPVEQCYSPPIFVGNGNVIIHSSTTQVFPCTQTCETISSPEYLNW